MSGSAAPERVPSALDAPLLALGMRAARTRDIARDTVESLNLLAEGAPDEVRRRKILVDNPARLFDFA